MLKKSWRLFWVPPNINIQNSQTIQGLMKSWHPYKEKYFVFFMKKLILWLTIFIHWNSQINTQQTGRENERANLYLTFCLLKFPNKVGSKSNFCFSLDRETRFIIWKLRLWKLNSQSIFFIWCRCCVCKKFVKVKCVWHLPFLFFRPVNFDTLGVNFCISKNEYF